MSDAAGQIDPVQADSVQADSVQSESVQSESVQSESVQSDSAQADSAQTDPAQPEPVRIDPPRARRGATDFRSWLFLRASGVALVVLVLGHLFVMSLVGGGVQRVNFAYVAGRWATPFWQLWDLLLLWLALLHGAIGMRAVIADLARRPALRLALVGLLYAATAVTLALGTLTILTFDPTR